MGGDAAESAILIVLCAGLWLVLWRRWQLRAAAAAAVPAVGGGAGRWQGAQQVSLSACLLLPYSIDHRFCWLLLCQCPSRADRAQQHQRMVLQ